MFPGRQFRTGRAPSGAGTVDHRAIVCCRGRRRLNGHHAFNDRYDGAIRALPDVETRPDSLHSNLAALDAERPRRIRADVEHCLPPQQHDLACIRAVAYLDGGIGVELHYRTVLEHGDNRHAQTPPRNRSTCSTIAGGYLGSHHSGIGPVERYDIRIGLRDQRLQPRPIRIPRRGQSAVQSGNGQECLDVGWRALQPPGERFAIDGRFAAQIVEPADRGLHDAFRQRRIHESPRSAGADRIPASIIWVLRRA